MQISRHGRGMDTRYLICPFCDREDSSLSGTFLARIADAHRLLFREGIIRLRVRTSLTDFEEIKLISTYAKHTKIRWQ